MVSPNAFGCPPKFVNYEILPFTTEATDFHKIMICVDLCLLWFVLTTEATDFHKNNDLCGFVNLVVCSYHRGYPSPWLGINNRNSVA